MSDRLITAEEAQKRLSELEAMSDWTGEDRIAAEYARTVIAQAEQVETLSRLLTGAEKSTIERAEQIKRLQAEIEEFDTAPVVSTEEERKILNELGYITAEDMEEK